jgi:hypothetical protein
LRAAWGDPQAPGKLITAEALAAVADSIDLAAAEALGEQVAAQLSACGARVLG